MGFFNTMTNIFRGKKYEKENKQDVVVNEPASINNMFVNSFVSFNFLPDHEELSGKTMSVTGIREFHFENGKAITYTELDHGDFYVRKEGACLEVLKEFNDNQAFLEATRGEEFQDILMLEDHEVHEDANGNLSISGNETEFNLDTEFECLQSGLYRVIKDTISAKIDNEKARFIRFKSNDSKNFINVFYIDGSGDTFISGSYLVPLRDVTHVG